MSWGFSWLRDYDSDRRRFAAEIAALRSDFKILLKTQNEAALLRKWIEHHIKIVGRSGILIFDHGSTDADVERVYQDYADTIMVFRYRGFHNIIHHRGCHPELYAALESSCRYYQFLDTDEFLVRTDGKNFVSDSSIVDSICRNEDVKLSPGVWLHNIMGYTDRFELSVNLHTLIAGLKWGKPILASSLASSEIQMHNMQVFEKHRETSLLTNFMLLHKNMVSPSQRINANLRKLVAYKVIPSVADLQAVLDMSPDDHEVETCRRFIKEVHDLSKLPADMMGNTGRSVRFQEDGQMIFENPENKQIFETFVENPDPAWVGWQ